MERLKKSLHALNKKTPEEKPQNKKDALNFNGILKRARKKHNFKIIAPLTLQVSDGDTQQIEETNIAIQDCFLEKINKTKSNKKLEAVHLEILNSIDFIENTEHYNVLAQHLYDRWLVINNKH